MGTIYWKPQQASDTVIKQGVKHLLDNSEILTAQIQWEPGTKDFLDRVKWIADLAHEHQRSLIVNLDWLADSRQQLRGKGWRFAQPETQQKFMETALSVCERYHPEYLNLGVEANFYALTDSSDFKVFLKTYHATKQRIKQRFPNTKVSISFQLELLMGNHTNWGKVATLEVLKAFGDDFDILALSTYPHSNSRKFGNLSSLSAILNLTNKPVGIFETSVPSSQYPETKQQQYLADLLAYLQRSERCEVLVWTSTIDTQAPAPKQSWIHYLGLFHADFTPKLAVATWSSWLKRPHQRQTIKSSGGGTAKVVR
ncbi:glycosyl hydrolase 53 family protein [Hymenobacter sp. DG01]|uniref:glycosyl hydrolase 53 family protein n=1 Tax=Hymenobacter sp. DG01 TaxID=2584940 RepID=UPI00111E04DD|nr:glycosyl hydrolase 53 family protein [Hymenobacter sp. DG01]